MSESIDPSDVVDNVNGWDREIKTINQKMNWLRTHKQRKEDWDNIGWHSLPLPLFGSLFWIFKSGLVGTVILAAFFYGICYMVLSMYRDKPSETFVNMHDQDVKYLMAFEYMLEIAQSERRNGRTVYDVHSISSEEICSKFDSEKRIVLQHHFYDPSGAFSEAWGRTPVS